MKVSIITVTYNSSNTIERTINSVLDQNYQNIEYIIIDGGSTDNTIQIINKYRNRISKIVSEKDKGIYDAMNKGVYFANGDLICFLNSDDIYFDNNIINIVVQEFINNNIDLVYGDVVFFKKNINKFTRYYSSKIFNLKMLKYGIMPAHQSMFIKKDIFDKFGNFSIKYKIAGDFDWVLRVFKNNTIKSKYLNKVLIKMQYGGVSTSGLKSKLLINSETLVSCRENGIKTNYLLLLLKYLFKIFQYRIF